MLLGLLMEAPAHPYELQRTIRRRGKDRVVNVGQRAGLYQTVNRLHRDGLIAVRETVRETARPERTVYEVTPAGREAFTRWLREMLAEPREEYPEFPAAVSCLPMLPAEDALRQLERRRARLSERLARLQEEIAAATGRLPRRALLEEEHRRALLAAELMWVASLTEDLRAGRLAWD
ncbi:PadR family transcriptional regulator [Thermocatellispora tengchongensis]|uniref:PadR family transcriptional regulator n=1 Tax=Thermocatellispora tengchongensis TaxID=1073253 RepID=UPI00363040DE